MMEAVNTARVVMMNATKNNTDADDGEYEDKA